MKVAGGHIHSSRENPLPPPLNDSPGIPQYRHIPYIVFNSEISVLLLLT